MSTIHLHHGDSFEVLASMPPRSVRAIITDPPYGLEFMGKEWDKLEPARNQSRWKDTERKLIGDGSGIGGDFGSRLGELPSYVPKRNRHCLKCGLYSFSNNPCKCEEPEWEHRELEHLHKMQEWHRGWLEGCFHVLIPGGVIKSFSATRTYHRMAAAMQDVGFQIVGLEAWAYGSGFPKSHNVSKAIDKHLGTQGDVVGEKTWKQGGGTSYQLRMGEETEVTTQTRAPGSPEAERFDGYGTALKPAWEPFVIGLKPALEYLPSGGMGTHP